MAWLSTLFAPWLAPLCVALLLLLAGAALLLAGIGRLKAFTLLPSSTLGRLRDLGRRLNARGDRTGG